MALPLSCDRRAYGDRRITAQPYPERTAILVAPAKAANDDSSLPFISVAGHTLEYFRIEPTGDPRTTLVLLHAGLGSVSAWQDFPAALCRQTGCGGLVYSRLGHGNSEGIREPLTVRFMHDEAQIVLPALLSALQIRSPILIGHSDGASIALIYAGTAADRPHALILEAPHVFVEDVTIESILRTRSRFVSGDLRNRLEAHHGANVDTLFEAWTGIWLSPEFRSWNIEEYLAGIESPTLVIQGLQDEYGTSKQVEAVVGAVAGPSESLMLADCRHAPHVDQRAAVESAMAWFVTSASHL